MGNEGVGLLAMDSVALGSSFQFPYLYTLRWLATCGPAKSVPNCYGSGVAGVLGLVKEASPTRDPV